MKETKKINLRLFDATTVMNTTKSNTTGNDLSVQMKTFYADLLRDEAKPNLVHNQFGQKRSIPTHGGKDIEFRRYSPYAKATTALTEGVTPDGRKLNNTAVKAEPKQYGDYTTVTDVLQTEAIDNNIAEATRLHGSQAGLTIDTITREVLNSSPNVLYAPIIAADGTVTEVVTRAALTKGAKLTPDMVRRAARALKVQNTRKINGSYVCVIHPDVVYDMISNPDWIDVHKYSATTEIFEGEIGKYAGVRFVESTEAKVWGGAGNGCDVYSTLFIGADAYGTIEVSGLGLEHIVKQLGSGGTADPLNQRATTGWKAMHTAVVLSPEYMVRVESASTFDIGSN